MNGLARCSVSRIVEAALIQASDVYSIITSLIDGGTDFVVIRPVMAQRIQTCDLLLYSRYVAGPDEL